MNAQPRFETFAFEEPEGPQARARDMADKFGKLWALTPDEGWRRMLVSVMSALVWTCVEDIRRKNAGENAIAFARAAHELLSVMRGEAMDFVRGSELSARLGEEAGAIGALARAETNADTRAVLEAAQAIVARVAQNAAPRVSGRPKGGGCAEI